ncbi:MAG: hypothetical protein PVI57_15765 [Gemmatimonadota bacterium]|jgi:hypothetical protein
MRASAPPGIPPLAGLCTHQEAARVGLSVAENVRRLLRFHWIEERCRAALVERIPSTPEWEVKGALALHQWYAAEHAAAVRRRVAEMRSPPPRMDVAPDEALAACLDQARAAEGTRELLTAWYAVLSPALAEAYRAHLDETNPLVDHPTRRVVRANLVDVEEALAWGAAALEAFGGPEPAFAGHVEAFLAVAGGVTGDADPGDRSPAPEPRPVPAPDFRPVRDDRFTGTHNFNFPPHVLHDADDVDVQERNLALLCKRLLEMDVPEMMASFVAERSDRPPEFHLDYGRQLWDEARHSMMGEVALEARGIDWRSIPLNVGFSLRLNLHAEPLERQLLLWAIEQSLMPSATGKRSEFETAVAAGDELSAHFHDYDWADEVLHAQIGRRWLLGERGEGLDFEQAMAEGRRVHEQTWSALEGYRNLEPQTEWWSDFVRRALGRETSAHPAQLVEDPEVITE